MKEMFFPILTIMLQVLLCMLLAYRIGLKKGREYADIKKLLTKDKLPVYIRDTDLEVLTELMQRKNGSAVYLAHPADEHSLQDVIKNQQVQFEKKLKKVVSELLRPNNDSNQQTKDTDTNHPNI